MTAAASALLRLDGWLQEHEYRGWDPYDALGARWGRLPGKRPRQAVVQAVKRSGPVLRRAIGVPQHRMTKTLALVAEGLTRAPWLPDAEARHRTLREEIRARRGPQAWGYEFDVQTRWGFYPAGSPNAIVTAFAVEAVGASLDEQERSAVATWLTTDMWAGNHFRYVPDNPTLVHNANVLAARTLHRVAPGDERIVIALDRSASLLPAGTGLWPYGEEKALAWVDNFHTGYVLDGLLDLLDFYPELDDVVSRASDAYVQRCFTPEAAPRYYADVAGRVDVHNIATALDVVSRLARQGLAEPSLVDGVLATALRIERAPGEFAPSPHAIAFPRWNQAHMHKALAGVTA